MKRLTNYYSGRVQGVGFRATVARLAMDFAITGRVCNLNDGRVELLAEGDLRELDAFRQRITEEMRRFIVDEQVHWGAASGEWHDFRIAADK